MNPSPATAAAIVLAIAGGLALTAVGFMLHPLIGMALLGISLLVGAAWAWHEDHP